MPAPRCVCATLTQVLPAGLEVLPELYATLPNSSRIPDLVVVPRTLAGDLLSLRPSDIVLAVEVESPSSVGGNPSGPAPRASHPFAVDLAG